jgi:hypothetical protein
VSENPPPQGQVSPDGRWWWDGAKWTPLPQPSTPLQPAYSLPTSSPQAVYTYGPRTNSAAVASLVFGIVSWFLCPFVGGLLAVIFGHVARGQIRRTGEGGSGLAVAGLILGYVHLAAAMVLGFIWLVLLGGFLATLGVLGNLPSPSP